MNRIIQKKNNPVDLSLPCGSCGLFSFTGNRVHLQYSCIHTMDFLPFFYQLKCFYSLYLPSVESVLIPYIT